MSRQDPSRRDNGHGVGLGRDVVDEVIAPIRKKSRWIGNGNVGFAKKEDELALGDCKGGDEVLVEFFFVIFHLEGGEGDVSRRNRRHRRGRHIIFCGFCQNCRELQKGL